MKKIMVLFLSLMLMVPGIETYAKSSMDAWDGSVDYSWYSPDASELTISSASGLAGLAAIVSGNGGSYQRDDFRGKTVRITQNLDMKNIEFSPIGIGNKGYGFSGTLDGGGNVILNLKLASGVKDGEIGFISRLDGENGAGLVKNLGLMDVRITSSAQTQANVGALVGYARYGQIENCFVRNIVFDKSILGKSGAYIGGIAGLLRGTMKDCYAVNLSVEENMQAIYFGAVVGYADDWNKNILNVENVYGAEYQDIPDGLPIAGVGYTNKTDAVSNCWYDGTQVPDNQAFGSEAMKEELTEALGPGFKENENAEYNCGYPMLSWEEEVQGGTETEETVFEVVSTTEDSVELTAVAGARYSMNNKDWTEDNHFSNLTPGLYRFYMRKMDDDAEIYTVMAYVGARSRNFKVWDGSVDTKWYDEESSVYYLYTGAELAGLSALARSASTGNFTGKKIYLMADLDMNNLAFAPIGYGARFFGGEFYGNGHIVKNLFITDSISDGEIGFFGRLDGKAENLGLENVSMNSTGAASHHVGGLAGYARYAEISGCFVRTADVSKFPGPVGNVGGLAGYMRGCTVRACYVTDFGISNTGLEPENLGGFCGNMIEDSEINGCYVGYDNGNAHPKLRGFANVNSSCLLSECYYDIPCALASSGSAAETDALKSLKLAAAFFQPAYGDHYNYGYPIQQWENTEGITYQQMELYTENGRAYLKISGLKNNMDSTLKPVVTCVLYDNDRMTAADFKIMHIDSYEMLTDDIVLSVDISGVSSTAEARGMLYQSFDKGIPLSAGTALELN